LIEFYIDQLKYVLSSLTSHEVLSITVQNLQNTTLKLTSILRSKSNDIAITSILEQVNIYIESAETSITEIFDDTKLFLKSSKSEYSTKIEAKLKVLWSIINSILKLRGSIEISLLDKLNANQMLDDSIRQINSIIKLHENDENEYVKYLVENLIAISNVLSNLTDLYNSSQENPLEWIEFSTSMVSCLENIKTITDSLKTYISDTSFMLSMEVYIASISHIIAQFKILSIAKLFRACETNSDEEDQQNQFLNLISPIKDFAFLCFPFSYNFRDSAYILSNETQ